MAREQRIVQCQNCGATVISALKIRDICRDCYRSEPRQECVICRQVRHNINNEGLCPGCELKNRQVHQECSRCHSLKPITDNNAILCGLCAAYESRRQEQSQRPLAECISCKRLRKPVLKERNICNSCWRSEVNGQDECILCGITKKLHIRSKKICKTCYQNSQASNKLREYITKYKTPFAVNQDYFELATTRIEWGKVSSYHYRQLSAFGDFLKTEKLPKHLSWEFIFERLESLSAQNGVKEKMLRASLWQLGQLLEERKELPEKYNAYLARRASLAPASKAPEHFRSCLLEYANWLAERNIVPETIRDHLEVLSGFCIWCSSKNILDMALVRTTLINDYVETLHWQWKCSECEEPTKNNTSKPTTPVQCQNCKKPQGLQRTRRHSINTVRQHCSKLRVFFDWAKITNRVVHNPVQYTIKAPDAKIQHYSAELYFQLGAYVKHQDSDPFEALLLYLILVHALSVQEITRAELPHITPIRDSIVTPSLADLYYIIIPSPKPSLGRLSPGRPDRRLLFPDEASTWLKPLLARFEKLRDKQVANPNNHYLFYQPQRVSYHPTPLSKEVTWRIVKDVTLKAVNVPCNPNALRKTAGIMLADFTDGSVLYHLGWSQSQAFQYVSAPREVITPRKES